MDTLNLDKKDATELSSSTCKNNENKESDIAQRIVSLYQEIITLVNNVETELKSLSEKKENAEILIYGSELAEHLKKISMDLFLAKMTDILLERFSLSTITSKIFFLDYIQDILKIKIDANRDLPSVLKHYTDVLEHKSLQEIVDEKINLS